MTPSVDPGQPVHLSAASFTELVALAQRMVKRYMLGRTEIVGDLLYRATVGAGRAQLFGLALALAREALDSAEDSRRHAARHHLMWQPAFTDLDTGALVYPTDPTDNPAALAMRLLDAEHRVRHDRERHDREARDGERSELAVPDPAAGDDFVTHVSRAIDLGEDTFTQVCAVLIDYASSHQQGEVNHRVEPLNDNAS